MAACALLALLALPAGAAPTSLAERNRAVLLEGLPPGALLEVRVLDAHGPRTEVWTAEAYASYRGEAAARHGRDYAAASGLIGSEEYEGYGDLFSDLWGTTTVRFETSVQCSPTLVRVDSKLWVYEGPCFLIHHDNECFLGFLCSFTYDSLLFCQCGSTHGDARLVGLGAAMVFPPPFGAIVEYDGAIRAE